MFRCFHTQILSKIHQNRRRNRSSFDGNRLEFDQRSICLYLFPSPSPPPTLLEQQINWVYVDWFPWWRVTLLIYLIDHHGGASFDLLAAVSVITGNSLLWKRCHKDLHNLKIPPAPPPASYPSISLSLLLSLPPTIFTPPPARTLRGPSSRVASLCKLPAAWMRMKTER